MGIETWQTVQKIKKNNKTDTCAHTHTHTRRRHRRSLDFTSPGPTLCSAMSGELAQGGEAGRDKGKAEGGSSAKGRTEPQPYTGSAEEAAVTIPWAFWSFYLSVEGTQSLRLCSSKRCKRRLHTHIYFL